MDINNEAQHPDPSMITATADEVASLYPLAPAWLLAKLLERDIAKLDIIEKPTEKLPKIAQKVE